jgi:hypothetical protein
MAQTLDSSPHHRALKIAAPVFAGLLLLGACSKKEDPPATSSSSNSSTTAKSGTSGSSGTAGTGSDTTTKSGSGTTEKPSGDTVKVDKTFWVNGFKVTLPDGKYDAAKETLTFKDATIENLGEDAATLYGTYSLEAEGTVAYTGNWTESPSVIAKSKAKDTLVFNVDDKFDASKTTLVIGSGNEAAVRIPFGDDGELVLRQPVVQEFKGKLTIGLADIDVTQTEVRWDRPDRHSQAEKGKAFLIITGKVKNNSDTTLYWDGVKAVLTRPDDTKTGADTVLGDGSVQTTQIDDKWGIIWEINEPVKGDYKIDFTQNFGAEGAEVTVSQDLSITDKASGSGTTGTTKK